MTVTHQVTLPCSQNTTSLCNNTVLARLRHGLNFRLANDFPDRIVNGYIEIDHNDSDQREAILPRLHTVRVVLYEQDEDANGRHLSYFRKLAIMPTPEQIRQRLEGVLVHAPI